MLKRVTSRGKKPCTQIRNIEFISKQPSKFFVFTFSSLQFKFSVHSCILCCLIAFPPHPFAYFLTSGHLRRNPDNSNFFRSLEGSSYRESTARRIFKFFAFLCGKKNFTGIDISVNFVIFGNNNIADFPKKFLLIN